MAAPEHVRVEPGQVLRGYESPPRRPGSWVPHRPGEIDHHQPEGPGFGSQGPDQGYVLRLARDLGDRLELYPGENLGDVIAGCAEVALKRASIFGRAPVIHDLTVAVTVWGFLDEEPPDELVAVRRRMFEGVANPHHYMERRRIAAAVPEPTLRLGSSEVTRAHSADWGSLLSLG
ncbi:MAG: hypothetical protein JJLCMIEE_03657 [Acidimicrobiales bacterium]|nr:MAG: hypothetical protein EDR02_11930 [Actinomycetota bacterium]MBV6510501.1 hypothetical protein [Acidimicrobiales bacterium]RIK07148.1 MAG: hypothetical protein DCC48_05010 [Acidobacteriota bacterium]